jgi:hypothetical protein
MKTIREHLNDLPEPYRTEALANNRHQFNWDVVYEDDVSEAILGAFNWSDTPQGYEYWSKFHDTL